MDEQNEKTLKSDADAETEGSSRRERKRAVDGESEPGTVRVRLPIAVGAKAREVVSILRDRGAQVSADELLAGYLESIPESYFEEQVTNRTPEQYYLEAAAKVPELREILIRHAKKGLMRGAPQKAEGTPARSPGRRKKATGDLSGDSRQSAVVSPVAGE